MARYIHLFETETEFNEERQNNYLEPWVSYTEASERVDYNKPYDPYLHMPFTIEALGSGNITWALGNKTVQYSKNGSSWETMNNATTISVVGGDEVAFKGTNSDYNNNVLSSTGQVNVKGNIMSLTDGDNYRTTYILRADNAFSTMLSESKIKSARYLVLPATTLTKNCYMYLFAASSSLEESPELLPATIMTQGCYLGMFFGCSSLRTVPKMSSTELGRQCFAQMFFRCSSLKYVPNDYLPSTTLADSCYMQMFRSCSSLETAPNLPAITLVNGCYEGLFQECSKINYVKCLATNPNAIYTSNWLTGVSASGTFVKNSAATWDDAGTGGIPTGWTVETAPA